MGWANERDQEAGVRGENGLLPAFAAVEVTTGVDGDADPATTLQALTPRLMRWSDRLWLLDLDACASYWQARAVLQETTAVELVRFLLRELPLGCVRAALADHPWQALLLVTHMQERRLPGFVLGRGPLGEALLREASWASWERCAERLAHHLAAIPAARRCDEALFRRQRREARRTAVRLGLSRPWQLAELPEAQIKRRFGALVRDLGQWATQTAQPMREMRAAGGLSPTMGTAAMPFASGFPWRSFAAASLPRVTRHLETPAVEWAHMEAVLCDDFDRLCQLDSWSSGERVVSLELRLVFCDLSCLIVPIRFRHPHALHLERGHHTTALLQALYAFQCAARAPVRRECDGVLYEAQTGASPIIGWDLVLTGRLTAVPRSIGLFGEREGETGDALALLALENKLPVRLAAYALCEDWLPEDSFTSAAPVGGRERPGAASVLTETVRAAGRRSHAAVAHTRPLYLYRKPTPFDSHGCSSVWRFLERTMAKWWQPHEGARGELQRDYYRLTDGEQRDFWVFKDTRGQWFVHGVFA